LPADLPSAPRGCRTRSSQAPPEAERWSASNRFCSKDSCERSVSPPSNASCHRRSTPRQTWPGCSPSARSTGWRSSDPQGRRPAGNRPNLQPPEATHEEEPMTMVKITPTDNGPYLIEGPARVVDADGNEYDLTDQTTIFLCRCGGSGTKPFCDGTHETLKFEAASRAPHVSPYGKKLGKSFVSVSDR